MQRSYQKNVSINKAKMAMKISTMINYICRNDKTVKLEELLFSFYLLRQNGLFFFLGAH